MVAVRKDYAAPTGLGISAETVLQRFRSYGAKAAARRRCRGAATNRHRARWPCANTLKGRRILSRMWRLSGCNFSNPEGIKSFSPVLPRRRSGYAG